ncbi:MAG TPA: endo alpha-1,4 polygalactosaminidase [Pseudonocardiaceae bacterium]|nr:endo alpha-1,4 polygalactosaminidase [Pseudonocardiaceae bacterium]
MARPRWLFLLVACLALAGCATSGTALPQTRPAATRTPPPTTSAAPMAPATTQTAPAEPTTKPAAPAPQHQRVIPPPTHVRFDYQIGQPYPPAAGVRVVTRDRTASPAPGLYDICYVNAFQAQPDATSWWQANHPDLILRDSGDQPVIDQNWNELLLDISTPAKRTALAAIVGGWLDGCAASGFNAVEPDNLDSWTHSTGLLTSDDALAYARLLIARAHADGLAIAQKNAAELAGAGRAAGFDFAVAEQCADYSECGSYTASYGDEVIVIEYSAAGLSAACTGWGAALTVVRRDLDVTAPGSSDYVDQAC